MFEHKKKPNFFTVWRFIFQCSDLHFSTFSFAYCFVFLWLRFYGRFLLRFYLLTIISFDSFGKAGMMPRYYFGFIMQMYSRFFKVIRFIKIKPLVFTNRVKCIFVGYSYNNNVFGNFLCIKAYFLKSMCLLVVGNDIGFLYCANNNIRVQKI